MRSHVKPSSRSCSPPSPFASESSFRPAAPGLLPVRCCFHMNCLHLLERNLVVGQGSCPSFPTGRWGLPLLSAPLPHFLSSPLAPEPALPSWGCVSKHSAPSYVQGVRPSASTTGQFNDSIPIGWLLLRGLDPLPREGASRAL